MASLELKFLKQGTLTVERPHRWDNMTDKQKEQWSNETLNEASDTDITKAMDDYSDVALHGHFDELELGAVVDPKGNDDEEYLFPTIAWLAWALGEDAVREVDQGVANVCLR